MNKLLTILLITSCLNLTAQFNIEMRNSISIFGLNTEHFIGYKYKKLNTSVLFTFNGDKGINNEIYLIDTKNSGIFINHKIYFNKYNAFIFDLPQLGYVKHLDEHLTIKYVMGPDIVNFANIGLGVNFYF